MALPRAAGDDTFTVRVVSFSTPSVFDLSQELALTKAALLYADRVRLVSPKVLILSILMALRRANPRQREEIMLELVSRTNAREVADTYRALKRSRNKTKEQLVAQATLNLQLQRAGQMLVGRVNDLVGRTGLDEIALAIDEGVLALDPLGAPGRPDAVRIAHTLLDAMASVLEKQPSPEVEITGPFPQSDFQDLAERAVTALVTSLAPAASDYPLLDDQAGALARGLVPVAASSGIALTAPRQPALAGTLIAELPAFAGASMERVLQVRKDLAEPLVGFRAAVEEMSRELDVSPLDETFPRRVSELHRERVAPRIADLRAGEAEIGVLALGRRTAAASAEEITKGVIALAAAQTFHADEVLKVLSAAAPPLAAGLAKALRERGDLLQTRRRNKLLFLYEAERRLG